MSAFLKSKHWIPEFRFHNVRRFRFDWADPVNKVAIEINGGVWVGGRHTSGAGFIKDMEKLNLATVMGYKILQYTPEQFRRGDPIADLEKIYAL